MAIQTPGCCDSEWQLLYKILQSLPDIGGGGGSPVSVENEGVQITAGVTNFDFVGTGVNATSVGNDVTVTITAGTGDVVGPAAAVDDRIATFDGATGKLIQDSGILISTVTIGPAVAVNNNIALFDGVTGKLIKDSGVAISSIVTNSTLQSGSQAVTIGTDTVSVVFPVAFAAAPTVVVSLSRPVAEGLIRVNIDQASITTLGFTASLGSNVGSANYRLTWMAK